MNLRDMIHLEMGSRVGNRPEVSQVKVGRVWLWVHDTDMSQIVSRWLVALVEDETT